MPFEQVKERQSHAWGAAPFEEVAQTIADVHDELVARLGPRPGEAWLDVATGTGEVALRAARAGARVTGADFAAPLVEIARRLAQEEGLAVDFQVADAESLPFADASFDVVSSCFGCMFAPDQRATAGELARVSKPGARLGLACWDPDGEIGDFFRLVTSVQPPPPGIGNPLDWGRREHASELLGDAFELEFVDASSMFEAESGEAVWQLFSRSFGPIKVLAETLDDEKREAFHRGFVDLHERHRTDAGLRIERSYLIVLGRRR